MIVSTNLLMMVWKRSLLPNRWIPIASVAFGGTIYPWIADVSLLSDRIPHKWLYNFVIGLVLGAASTGLFEVVRSAVKHRTGFDLGAAHSETDFLKKRQAEAETRSILKSGSDKAMEKSHVENVEK